MLQRQVYPRSEEAGRKHQAADLHFEASVGPRILVHDKAPNVSDTFSECSNPNGEHEGPCSRPCSDDYLRDEEEAEERGEKGVGAEVWVVAVECRLDGAECAHGVAEIMAVLPHVEGFVVGG